MPSIRSLSPLTSARVTLTAACADSARANEKTANTAEIANQTRTVRPIMPRS